MPGSLQPELGSFETFTFDYNPIKKNLKPAKQVGDLLDIPNSVERHTPEEFVDIARKGVRLTNGMVHWRNFFAFPFVLSKSRDQFDMLVANFGQGELFGEYLNLSQLNLGSPVAALSTETKKREAVSYFDGDVDIEGELRDAVGTRRDLNARETVHDVFLTSFYPWFHFSKMNVHRSQLDTRLVMTNTDLVDAAVRLPDDLRRRPIDFPFFDTMLPTAPAKYELIRDLEGGLGRIPSNSLILVSYPLVLHILVYSTWRKIPKASLQKPHFGFLRKAHNYREWIVNDETFRTFVDDLLDSAKTRDCFDADRLAEIQSDKYSNPLPPTLRRFPQSRPSRS